MINKTLFILNIFCCSFLHGIPMYFALASDTEFFSKAKRLIESIKKSNGDSLVEIAFFDVGLTQNERDYLKKQDKVKLFDIERTNQFITSQFIVRLDGTKCARGSFSWKPVVLKQCLDMYPYVFYLDSGMRVVGNFTDLFKIVINKGYFLVEAGHSMKGMVIKKVKKFFSIDDNSDFWNKKAIAAGIQGVSRLVYDSYVFPIYKMTSDITLFEDDGSADRGFGWGRHDQSIFSILVNKLNYEIITDYCLGRVLYIPEGNGRIKKINFKASDYWLFKDE